MTVGQSERKNILNEHTLDWFGFLSHFNLILIFLTLAPGAWDASNISVMVLLHLQPPLQPACLSGTAYFLQLEQYLKNPSRTRPTVQEFAPTPTNEVVSAQKTCGYWGEALGMSWDSPAALSALFASPSCWHSDLDPTAPCAPPFVTKSHSMTTLMTKEAVEV